MTSPLDRSDRAARADAWRRVADWPLTVAALAFLVAYSVEVIADLEGPEADPTEWVINITWALFVVDYVVSLVLAEHRGRWFVRHLLDLLVVALPILRPLRLIRVVTILGVVRRSAGFAFRGRVIIYASAATLLLLYVAALAELDAERGYGSIADFGDAIWWAFTTITTVGYGDFVPVTFVGRFVAIGLMIGGIAMLGIVTASFASWIVQRVADADEREQAATRRQVNDLAEQVVALREILQTFERPRVDD